MTTRTTILLTLGIFLQAAPAWCDEPAATEPPKPAPGKQVAQTVELPAMAALLWTDKQRAAEMAKVNALPEEQRDAEVRRQRFQRFNLLSPLRETEKQAVSYWLFLPSDYDPGAKKKWPLLLFLHGYGAASTDLDQVKSVGPPKLLDDPDKAKDWPFITVSPQCPGDSAWAWRPLQLAALLDELEKHYAIDTDRVYVTGPSMGGIGTWALLYHLPGRFAAGVPVSGGFSPEGAKRFVDTPIWAFHGGKDNITPLPLAEEMVEAVRSAGGKHVELTVYPDAGHDAWTEAYDDPKLYDWLLKQRRPPREATTRSGNE